MNPEMVERVLEMFDLLKLAMLKVAGTESLDQTALEFRQLLDTVGPHATPLVLELAKKMNPLADCSITEDMVFPMLMAPDWRDRLRDELSKRPDDEAPETIRAVEQMLKRDLPSLRTEGLSRLSLLPHDPGGRPPERPNPEECRAICAEISRLIPAYGIGGAQRKIAGRRGLTFRMVQTIWQARERNEDDNLKADLD